MTGSSYCPILLAYENRDRDTLVRELESLERDKARLDYLEGRRAEAARKGRRWDAFYFDTENQSPQDIRAQLDQQRGADT
jgi:hypothetical protein